ncbi:hypothetical protein EUX98_g5296 [Antrodiella citrinella]|uniref:Uncharacterized protein n=1 Tax=Antrodiella citrinella TaxID=2447956 RepID=A0A4S4MRW4_9APHY|nr:hypothetical protein EUX98_g5296 [Antrodiella citrinella]
MHLTVRRSVSNALCPPETPFCKPSTGPGPSMVGHQKDNALIGQPYVSTGDYSSPHVDASSQAEINAIGVVVIIVILMVLVCLWAGLADWPRGKIKAWVKGRVAKRSERARRKTQALATTTSNAIAEVKGSPTSAKDLSQADIESAVGMINNSMANRTVGPALTMQKNISSTSTVVEEEVMRSVEGSLPPIHVQGTVTSLPKLAEPTRAVVRDSSWPKLPIIPPGSPLGSLRVNRK